MILELECYKFSYTNNKFLTFLFMHIHSPYIKGASSLPVNNKVQGKHLREKTHKRQGKRKRKQ